MATHSMDDAFDFKAAGYAAPADWARLYDLLPDPGEGLGVFNSDAVVTVCRPGVKKSDRPRVPLLGLIRIADAAEEKT